MPRARIPAIEIQIGGDTRHLIFGHHALGELEEQAATLGSGARIKSVILALWAGLLTETLDGQGRATTRMVGKKGEVIRLGTLSRFEVAALMDELEDEEIEAVADKLLEAQRIAKPQAEENPTTASEAAPV